MLRSTRVWPPPKSLEPFCSHRSLRDHSGKAMLVLHTSFLKLRLLSALPPCFYQSPHLDKSHMMMLLMLQHLRSNCVCAPRKSFESLRSHRSRRDHSCKPIVVFHTSCLLLYLPP